MIDPTERRLVSLTIRRGIIDKMFCLNCSNLAKNKTKYNAIPAPGRPVCQAIYVYVSIYIHLYIPPDIYGEAEFLSLCGRVTQNVIFKQGVRSFSRTTPDQTGAGPGQNEKHIAKTHPLHMHHMPMRIMKIYNFSNDP